ncbi:MAG: molecular chaperone HtpG [Micavibrio aeruginosavorus]|uniref:Chaperone protein HtpG n=1 Tax=Micavibrio aeruginosavorus TaxID=349221 RepID=A0A7T5UI58_9BACT|nr:MAG: molecular chaperone HtpG [Micavibrio aeruginosavorus]
MTTETLSFGADVSRLLDIVAHALYSNRDVFLRELISNAADACDRLRYEAITKPYLTVDDPSFKVRIYRDPRTRILTVVDNGIGMNREELIKNLGTIAWSGTAAVMEQLGQSSSPQDKLSLIGQFGVGFYASFMVSTRVKVVSRKAGEDQTWVWESDGKTGFTVREAAPDEAKQLIAGRGAAINLTIDDNSSEYLLEEKLRMVVIQYSDHIDIPIFLGRGDGTDADNGAAQIPVNKASALWMRSRNDINDEQYVEFYHHIGHGMDKPMMTSHWHAEGKIEYTALLFVPTLRPWDLYDPGRKNATRLYVKRVFITDQCDGLMYPWLRFMRGVIDTEDLPLNISREMLQHNPVIQKIRTSVAKRILGDLDKLAQDNPMQYGAFWGQFGAVLKEGLYDAPEHRTDLLKVARFHSTEKADGLVSLTDYASRMKPEQEHIYYISGENIDNLRNSPQIEGFKARGIEVLLFTDTIDDFWLQSVLDYEGKAFKSVTKGDVDLSKFNVPANDQTEEKKQEPSKDESLRRLLVIIQETLKDDIGEVRYSHRLTSSPACLVAAENEVDLRMERVLRVHQKYETPSKRILEINPDHALIRRMASLAKAGSTGEDMADAAHLLLDQARIIQGEPIPDPADFARRLSYFMEKSLAA